MRIVFDQSLLDKEVQIIMAQLNRSPTLHLLHKAFGNTEGYSRDEITILIVEDPFLLLLARKKKIGERFPNGISHIRQGKLHLPSTPRYNDFGYWSTVLTCEGFSPVVALTTRFIAMPIRNNLLQCDIFLEGNGSIHKRSLECEDSRKG